MSDKTRETQAMYLLNEISEAPNETAIYECLDRIDVFLGKKEGALEWPVAALAQPPAPVAVPEGWKMVPVDATLAMVDALKARIAVTSRGGILNAGNALNDAIAAAPAAEQPDCDCCNGSGYIHGTECGACAEQPDTVKVPRLLLTEVLEVAEDVGHEGLRIELRSLLGKEDA